LIGSSFASFFSYNERLVNMLGELLTKNLET